MLNETLIKKQIGISNDCQLQQVTGYFDTTGFFHKCLLPWSRFNSLNELHPTVKSFEVITYCLLSKERELVWVDVVKGMVC
jgi:hypothetical protein